MNVTGGATNVTTYFALRLAADGTAATGLTITNMDLQYVRSGAAPAAKVDATALAATDSAHGDNQAIEIDATDQPGLYRVDWPDAAFAAGVREVILTVKIATCFTEHLRVQIDPEVSVTEWNGVKLSTTNPLPNAAPDSSGGLATEDASGHLAVDVREWLGTAVTTSATTTKPEVDAASISDNAAAADNVQANIGNLDAPVSTVDTVVDAIKTKTDSLTFTVANQVDANMLAISGDTQAADRMEEAADSVITGTVDATPAPDTVSFGFTGTNGHTESGVDDFYNGKIITFVTGNLAGQSTDITDYSLTNNVFTVTALTAAPDSGSVFTIT